VARRESLMSQLGQRLAEVAGWHTVTRDDAKVVGELYATRTIDDIKSLNEAAFFDELFCYIREIGAWPLFEQLDPQDRQRALYPFMQFVLFTVMRCVGGVQSLLATHDVLLTDESLMGLLGFNAIQVKQGSNARGQDRRTEPVEVRGAFSYETVADNIVKIGPEALAKMFNGVIRCLAAQGIFPKKVDVSLDATDDEATPTYTTDDGREVPHVTRHKRPDVRANRHARKVAATVHGWKIWLVWEPTSQVPLAMIVGDINEADNTHALAVLLQARANIQGYAELRSVALDRGFLDGKLLSAIEAEGIIVYIPAKNNLDITKDAREIARRAEKAAQQGRTLPGAVYKERTRTVTRGSGKNAVEQEQTTSLVSVSDLPCDWWNPQGSDFIPKQPKKLRATVVLRWDGAPKDAEKEVVILTTHTSDDPFVAFDAYDDRSLIENCCNREAKETWFLEHHPKRSESGLRVHAYFVFVCMALMAGFRAYKSKIDEAHRKGQDTGMSRYRRQLEASNSDKILIVIGSSFAILRTFELALLGGLSVQKQQAAGESAYTVLRRYGVPVPDD